MGLQSLFVVNKAGSLIFYRRLSDAAPKLSQNDYLHLASTFHGMQLLVQELSPERSTFGYGIVTLVTSTYTLQAFRAASGVQFFVTADVNTENLGQFLVSLFNVFFLSRPIPSNSAVCQSLRFAVTDQMCRGRCTFFTPTTS